MSGKPIGEREQSGTHQTNQCEKCNSYISFQFARVFGDNNNRVYGCLNCEKLHVLREGEGGTADQ